MENDVQIVRFLKSKTPYNANDTAGFPRHVAHILISTGYAEPIQVDGEPDTDYKGMSWFKLRAEVRKITGETPTNKDNALAILQQRGLI